MFKQARSTNAGALASAPSSPGELGGTSTLLKVGEPTPGAARGYLASAPLSGTPTSAASHSGADRLQVANAALYSASASSYMSRFGPSSTLATTSLASPAAQQAALRSTAAAAASWTATGAPPSRSVGSGIPRPSSSSRAAAVQAVVVADADAVVAARERQVERDKRERAGRDELDRQRALDVSRAAHERAARELEERDAAIVRETEEAANRARERERDSIAARQRDRERERVAAVARERERVTAEVGAVASRVAPTSAAAVSRSHSPPVPAVANRLKGGGGADATSFSEYDVLASRLPPVASTAAGLRRAAPLSDDAVSGGVVDARKEQLCRERRQ
jgi:hypothetical protein